MSACVALHRTPFCQRPKFGVSTSLKQRTKNIVSCTKCFCHFSAGADRQADVNCQPNLVRLNHLSVLQVHLFDIDIPEKQTFKESDTLTAGECLTVVDTDCGRLGIGICYDIRFPEMAAIYAQRGVQLLVYPGSDISLLSEN